MLSQLFGLLTNARTPTARTSASVAPPISPRKSVSVPPPHSPCQPASAMRPQPPCKPDWIALPKSGDTTDRLKALPAEIRNQIFAYAVIEPNEVRLKSRPYDHGRMEWYLEPERMGYSQTSLFQRYLTGVALASTCRQYRKEVEPVFFAENTFSFELMRDWEPQHKGNHFPAKRTTKFVIRIHDWERVDEYHGRELSARICVNQCEDKTLEITTENFMVELCMCRLEHMAKKCKGDGCVGKFVREFRGLNLFTHFRNKINRVPARVCPGCGKA